MRFIYKGHLKPEESSGIDHDFLRFIKITNELPEEIQMRIMIKAYHSRKETISIDDINKAIKSFTL